MIENLWPVNAAKRTSIAIALAVVLNAAGPQVQAASAPPLVDVAATTSSQNEATLRARVDPRGQATSYYFEMGATTAYGTRFQAGEAGSGSGWVMTHQVVKDLQPRRIYHYRTVASNADGMTFGADRVVRMGPGLPDGRAYELVSPREKNGSDVTPDSGRTRVAADGSAAQWVSLAGAFGQAHGTGFSGEYLSERTSEGWVSHGITPLLRPQTFGEVVSALFDPRYFGEFSADLDKGVLVANRLLTSEGANVAGYRNLYLRNSLRSPRDDTWSLLSDAFEPLNASKTYRPAFIGASDDFTHVVFVAPANLTPDAPPQSPECAVEDNCRPRLYEWVEHGEVRLVGVLPDDECAASGQPAGCAATRSVGGRAYGATFYTPHVISRNGSRVVFMSSEVSNSAIEGRLYLREDGVRTLRINESERTDCAGDPSCGGDGLPDPESAAEQPATYWDASEDGSVVYFVSAEQLTDEPIGARALYRWDRDAPAGQRLTLISVDEEGSDPAQDVEGVVGTSADGEYVYFTGASQLVAGAPPRPASGELLLFVWHAGEVRFVGNVTSGDSGADLLATSGWVISQRLGRVTRDGKHLLFSSRSQVGLTRYAPGACGADEWCRELYVYSFDGNGGEGALACASCSLDGRPYGTSTMVREATGASGTGASLPRALSEDGRRVFFHTRNALVSEDRNGGVRDVYVYDVPSGQVSLISSGRSDTNSFFLGASTSGDDVFFVTRERLVRSDVDTSYDMYDARVGGGFAEPEDERECADDRCQGALGGAPQDLALGSSTARDDAQPSGHAAVFWMRTLLARQARRLAAGSSARLTVRVSEAGRVRARIRARVGGRLTLVASASKRARRGGDVQLALRLSPRAVRQLRARGRLRVVIAAEFSPVPGVQRQRLILKVGR